jgi:alpha-L-rhamnosidase
MPGFSSPVPKIISLKCEYSANPIGVASLQPIFNWTFSSARRNVTQSAYQIIVAHAVTALQTDQGTIWNSGKVPSNSSIQVRYGGKPLQSGKTYFYKIKIWDNKGISSGWSKIASWQMGLLKPEDWKGAKWIGYEELPEREKIIPAVHLRGAFPEKNDILPLFRKKFNIRKTVKQATAFISGLGHFDLSLNGIKVGDHFLDPGWTKYDEQALYVTFDLTKKIKQGGNALGVVLGNGFYFIPRDQRYRKITGAYGYPKLICRLLLEYTDGSTENIITDESWKTSPSPITYTSIYGGEDYNATLEQKNWNTPTFDETQWKSALVVKGSPVLNAQIAEPLKVFENFTPVQITQVKPGVWVYDMGQNASAIPAIAVKGKRGAIVKISPGELLNKDGTVNQFASGHPHYYNYTLSGQGIEQWQPKFTYYGFRYIQVEGSVPEKEANPENKPVMVSLKSLHIRNAAKRAGTFSCSNELFNKTNTLIDWAIKSNMVSVFTDCPHREKLGWLEEAHLMGSSVHYNYDVASLYKKIVDDMIISQTKDGLVPDIAPEYVHFDNGFRDSPEWGSSSIIVPWYVYEWYGDKAVLAKSYPMMEKYLAYLQRKADGHILSHGLGDWFDIGPKNPGQAQLTPIALSATAIYHYDLNIISKIAGLLNKPDDQAKYHDLAMKVKTAFNTKFFDKNTKQYATGSQTANAMAVYMDLVDPLDKQAVVENLVKEIKGRGNSLTAGDIGYRYVLRVLDDASRSDVIYDMNSRSDVPGYGWQLAHGATALTESWQAYGFVSNNHFMLGHLMEWLYSGIGGIRNARGSIAYKTAEIRPQIVGDLTNARVTYDAPYGTILSSWKKTNGNFELVVEIPANSSAIVYLPATVASVIHENGKAIHGSKLFPSARVDSKQVKIALGSGKYHFNVKN